MCFKDKNGFNVRHDQIPEFFVKGDEQKFQEFHYLLCILTLILIEISSIALYFLPQYYTVITVRRGCIHCP